MISLQDLIGTQIIAYVPVFDRIKWQHLKLVNVEPSGIWVESKEILEWFLKESGVTASPKTAVFFLPFSQIVHIVASLDVPYISDEALR
jgi:hypothetical protein